LFAELLRFMNTEGRTILISSHQLSDLERFADHVAILNKGKLLSTGRTDQMLERYRLFDARITRDRPFAVAGVQLLEHAGERVKILVDNDCAPGDALAQLQVEVIAEVPLSLEDLFLNLIAGDD
jgi:ABC-2 type transport system ATP-binding protein